ncbi:MAG: hypothetical protein H0U49_00855 [Parachlamydiaceae bacterium]|nr:hypothetical protein [Parachlamydiaceae bacterium]
MAKFVFAHKSQIDPKLCQALDHKIAFWNLKHSPNLKIMTIDPNFSKSEFQVKNNGNFSKWLKITDRDISAETEIIKILPKDTFICVSSKIDKPETFKNAFSNYQDAPTNGNIGVVTLQPTTVSSAFMLLKKGFPDMNKIALYLNGETKDGAEELVKLAALGFTTDLFFYQDKQNNMHIKISLRSNK